MLIFTKFQISFIGRCPPLSIANGRIDYKGKSPGGGKYPFGFRADIICNSGFTHYSYESSFCGVSGTWDVTPRCGSKHIDYSNFYE